MAKEYLDFYAETALVAENSFIHAVSDRSPVPSLNDVRTRLPQPFWDGPRGADAVACYWRTWEIAFGNLRSATPSFGVAPYIDTAFNNCLFMWDSTFILMGLRYGERAFAFQRTLDSLYAKQHRDGFISREIREWSGHDQFHRHDPASTGPNVMAWCEWEYYQSFNDKARLRRVFVPLLAYHQWLRKHRTWPDGSYFSCGLACGMDNQPRTLPGGNALLDHSWQAWVDATAQACISARLLVHMAEELGEAGCPEVEDCLMEAAQLQSYMMSHMWDAEHQTFADRRLKTGDGHREHSPTRTIGAYWALLADVVTPDRMAPFVGALDDPALFNRAVRPPTLAAADPDYRHDGGYWLGGVWPPTAYMVLRGLTRTGHDDVAADIGANYHDAVVKCFKDTGTIWENMAPELRGGRPVPGAPAKRDFVGWGALGPVAIFFEYVLGLRADVPRGELVWDIRLLERHGMRAYPFGATGLLDLECAPRAGASEPPRVRITTSMPIRVVLRWGKSATTQGSVAPDRSSSLPVHEKVVTLIAASSTEVLCE